MEKDMESTNDRSDRTFATLAHASGIFFPFMGPIVVLVLKGKSRFVKSHALHALIGTLLLDAFLILLGIISLTYSIISLYRHYQENWENFNIWHVIIRSAVTWIIIGLIGICNTILNLVQAIRAWNGKPAGGGLTGRIVRKFMGKKPELEATA
ncbi:MAG: DUF4870 domain-containing protein [Fimbriimonadaceae bacterium]|nr:DUF4870 domain-containing protein [Fimbriimonadaceae bacterium]